MPMSTPLQEHKPQIRFSYTNENSSSSIGKSQRVQVGETDLDE